MPWTLEHRTLQARLDSLAQRIEQLDTDQRQALLGLRAGLSEELANNNERIEVLSAKLDDYLSQLRRLAQRAGRVSAESAAAPTATGAAALYHQAYGDYTRGRLEIARQGFREYLRSYPETDLADNAQYWLGECLYDLDSVAAAQAEFQKVVDSFPESDKAPAAALKVGRCLERLGDKAGARAQYQAVLRKYPGSQEAKLAEESLRRL